MEGLQRLTIDGKIVGLTLNQRNLYRYYLAHRKKYGDAPCFIPRNPIQGHYLDKESKLDSYLKIVQTLEDLNLFRVIRQGDNYMNWMLIPPTNEQTNDLRSDSRALADPQDQVRHC